MKLKKFKIQEMLPTWEEFKEFYLIYIKKHPDDQYIPKNPTRFVFIFFWLYVYIKLSRCWLFGHDIKEWDHADSDNNKITWECKRCGWISSHTL